MPLSGIVNALLRTTATPATETIDLRDSSDDGEHNSRQIPIAIAGQGDELGSRSFLGTSPQHLRTSQRRSFEDDDDEDEITVATCMPLAKRPRLENARPQRIRMAAARLIDGILTPLTSETANSENDRLSSRENLPKMKVPEWRVNAEPTHSLAEYREVSEDELARAREKTAMVILPGPAYPRFLYDGWQPPVHIEREHRAVQQLQNEFRDTYPDYNGRPEYTYFTLDDFCVYRHHDSAWHSQELVTLEKLTLPLYSKFLCAGVLRFGDMRFYVKDVLFETMTLEYGLSPSRPWKDRVCIQSAIAKQQDVYYKLGKPASEYRRFYEPFLVLAQFADYLIDYMSDLEHVTISHFRADFWQWLLLHHSAEPDFQSWHHQIKLQDFRTLVAVNVEFLWKECWDIDTQSVSSEEPTTLCQHPLWSEVHPERLDAIPIQPVNFEMKTVVTPFAFHCFKSMYFADMLGACAVGETVRDRVIGLKTTLGLSPLCDSAPAPSKPLRNKPIMNVAEVRVGDVVVIPADKSNTGGWKASTADLWYAYVQRLWTDRKESMRMDVIWLYQPEDTTIGNAYYPFSNELFLSDNCGCGKQEALHLDSVGDIVGKAAISWFVTDPAAQPGLFVRRTFRTVPERDQHDFVTLREEHFNCCHQAGYVDPTPVNYNVGDTVLVRKKVDTSGRNCRPAIITGMGPGPDRVQLRKLAFASDILPNQGTRPASNELVLTDMISERPVDDIVRPCSVRTFSRDENIPTPYDRNGASDFYYVVQDSSEGTSPFKEGWDPSHAAELPTLTGLGIFCGGGAFDRGLEEGGAVRFRYAVDLAAKALYSYRANDLHPEKTSYYLGSVNEYLACAMSGEQSEAHTVAEPGSLHVISAGSPCQGFSRLQQDRQSHQSRRNASMVASVISFVDLYAPRYLLLENVHSMASNIKDHGGQNVLSQMIASLVALGYQVQQFLSDSSYHGSPQDRSRVFIIATAPTCVVLNQPEYTHARRGLHRSRNLGRCSNGKPFGSRRNDAFVPFAQVSARESVLDLPMAFDSQTRLCPSHPDHYTAREETVTIRRRMAAIPKRPHGMGLRKAAEAGLLCGEPLEYSKGRNVIKCGPNSKAYRRVFPDKPFPTMVTRLNVGDGMAGQVVHWEEDRVLTVMEARRAQGYPDYEVLVGTSADRLKIVGNSVDRIVALVLGLSLRESWLKSPPVSESVEQDSDVLEHDFARDTAVSNEHASFDEVSNDAPVALDGKDVDNKFVKMWLNLSPEEREEMRKGGFKSIISVLSSP